jgi:hypothetical protein
MLEEAYNGKRHQNILVKDGDTMSTQPRDTRPEAERVRSELFRKATMSRRLELGLSLSQEAIEIVQAAILRANPLASEEERKLIFVELTYGKKLADRVRAYLAEKRG